MNILPRMHESATHKYKIEYRDQRVTLVTTSKVHSNYKCIVSFPVADSFVVGDLISTVYLEHTGFERADVWPDELRVSDVVEGVGVISEVQRMPMEHLELVQVSIPVAGASITYTREVGARWPERVGITRPIKDDAFE